MVSNLAKFSSPITQPLHEWRKLQQDSQTSQKDKFAAFIEINKLLISVLGTGATILGGYMLILNFKVANKQAEIANKQAKIAQTRFVTETFSKAVEQLESDKLAIRLGGIYSLERIADSPKFYWMVIKLLNAIVVDRSPLAVSDQSLFYSLNYPSQEELQKQVNNKNQVDYIYVLEKKPATDIAAILSFLGKPHKYKEAFLHELGYIDLSRTELIRARITSADFKKCFFQSTDFRFAFIADTNFKESFLRDADFRWAKVSFTNFTEADLINARFDQAELIRTNFNQAKLIGAEFNQADLHDTQFNQADLVGATFHHADLSGATFDEAKLSMVVEDKQIAKADFRKAKNLDPKKVKKALGWEQAFYDDDFRQRLGLPASEANE